MKKLLITFLLLFVTIGLFAQIDLNKVVNRSAKKAERNVERRVERRIDKGVDKVLDKTEEGIDETVKGDGKDKKKEDSKSDNKSKESKSETKPNNKQATDNTAPGKDEAPAPNEPEKQKPVLEWAKYDFVPGSEIIFEDNHEGEQNGEFPGKWDLSGGTVENVYFDGSPAIMFRKNNINGLDGIVPMVKNRKEDYLPEEFTIEFDAYFPKYYNTYRIYLLDPKNQKNLETTNNINNRFSLKFEQNSASGKNISSSYYPGFSTNNTTSIPGWRHISISFNKRALKAYIDDARILNIPNLEINPVGFCIAFHNPSDKEAGYIKNVRIAKGAVPLYEKVLTDGKFVTTGIKFDVNKATLKAESIGTINYVVKMMQDNPGLKFSVEGHTDSDGDDVSNLKLSEARAKAVMDKLTELGIAKDRLSSKGHGESNPLTANDTPEGKAQNRRVEFVKF